MRAFVPFVASVLIKAWKNSDHESGDIELVLSGVVALSDEIEWFKQEASKWGVELSGVVPEKTTQDYCRFHLQFNSKVSCLAVSNHSILFYVLTFRLMLVSVVSKRDLHERG